MGAASLAQAADKFCADPPYNGVIDGNVLANAPTQITINDTCTFQNWSQSKPLGTNINFQTNDPSIYLIVFDNVWYTGNLACANIPHKLWVVNSPEGAFSGSCQDIMIPAETIAKASPGPYAAIGVPFTYTLTLPSMNFPAGAPSPNTLGNVTLRDDLNATGASLTLVGTPQVTWDDGSAVTHTLTKSDPTKGGLLTFELPNIPAGRQIEIEITVVPDTTNTVGTVFTNVAKWDFSRSIDLDENGIIEDGTADLDGDGILEDEFFDPLPGEWGVSAPMTIAGPDLIVNKTSNETALNLGTVATFIIDVQNTGAVDAYKVTLLDRLPDHADTGMCDDPRTTLSAKIVEADGTTLVRDLLPTTDYTLSYAGPTTCELTFTMTPAGGAIGPNEHLIVSYRAGLDADTKASADGIALTNVAGASQWFSADGAYPSVTYSKVVSTDGAVAAASVDHQDSYTIYSALAGYYFQKIASNRTSLASPTTTAAPGDEIRYRLRLFNVTETINDIRISDVLDPTRFDLTSFSMVTDLAAKGANYTFDSTTGLLTISGNGAPLNLVPPAELVIEFDVTLKPDLTNGTVVENRASLTAGPIITLSDDPYVNGVAPPPTSYPPPAGYADPTRVMIQTPGALKKENPVNTSVTIGEQFTYRITVPEVATPVPLYDVRILDTLSSAVDLRFVSARLVSDGRALSNTGSATSLVIEDPVVGIDIPANGQAVIEITVELSNSNKNNSVPVLTFNNSASYTYNRANGNAATRTPGGTGSAPDMTVVEPAITATKTVRNVTAGKQPADPAAVGDILEYVVTLPNGGASTAFDTNVVDALPAKVSLIADSATAQINGVAVIGFVVNPTPLSGGRVAWGRENGDGTLDIPASQSLVLTYRVTVGSVNGMPINNSVYTDWTSLQDSQDEERTGAGCPATTAPNDYCYGPVAVAKDTVDMTTVVKSVVSDTYAEAPAVTPPVVRVGDTVVYRLALTLREGPLQNVVVTDTLPAGLTFDGVASVNGDTTAPFSAVGPFTYADFAAPAVSGNTVTWNLGDITNAADNDDTNDTFVIEYRARVLTDTLAHAASTPLTNNVALSYAGSDPAAARLRSSANLTVLQPIMTTPTKSAAGFTSPASVDITTDVMPFHLESCNTSGLVPAYSVKLIDELATQLNESTITTPVLRVGGTLLTAGADYSYTPPAGRGGTMIFMLNTPVNPGQCVTIEYSIGFYTDFGPNQTWTNSVSIEEYWSLPLQSGQKYGPLGPTIFTMTNSATITSPIKTLLMPASNEATIGQDVVYRIAVPGTPTNATIYNVVITDTLNGALQYVSAADVSGNGFALNYTSGAPNQVNLTIAQIPAGEQAIIELRARVANNASANAGVSFANSASYTYADSMGGTAISGGSDATDTPLTVVEPSVAVSKSVAPNAPPSVGATLTYTLTLTAAGGAAGDVYSNAYDVSIVDTLGLGLDYVEGSATLAGAPIADPSTNGADGITAKQVLTWNTGLDIPEGTAPAPSVTYQVRVLSNVSANQVLRNDVRVAWTSLDGVNANERTGTGTPAYSDYFATAFTSLTTPAPGALSKQNPATPTVTIGQPFTYTIAVPEVVSTTALHDVKVIDNLPAGVALVGVSKVSTWGTWAPQNSGTTTSVVITNNNGQGIDIPAGERMEIALTVVLVDDVVTNYSGRTFSNTASYTYNEVDNNAATQQPGGGATTGDLTIIGPDRLTLEKSGPADMNLDVPGTFTLNMHNAGTGTAWGVTVTDRLPNPTPGGMCDAAPTNVTAQLYRADGTTPVGGALAAGSDFTVTFAGAPSCTFTITMQSAAGAIPADHRLIITYRALLDGDNVNGVPITNLAGATQWYGANPAPGVTPRTYTRTLTNGTVGTVDHEDAHTVNPVIPLNGIVYDSVTRRPIAGAVITMLRASTGVALPSGCFVDPAQQNQVTNTYGHYTFELNFSQPECPSDADYVIAVTAAPAGYDTSAPSRIIPPITSAVTAAYSVPLCPADAVPSTTDRCEAQSSSATPTGTATAYYLHLTLSNNVVNNATTPPTTSDVNNQIFNNHIPLDPIIDAAISISKKSPLVSVTRGQMVPYTITVKNTMGGALQDLTIIDTLPPGFKYVEGSSRFDGKPVEPLAVGRQLRWENLALVYNETHTIKLLLAVSSGLSEGEYVNQAQVLSNVLGGPASGIATATVRLVPDPAFDCTDVIGKVYDDANANGYQDDGETGLPGARVVSARGLIARTDAHGRFHITCAAIPNEDRGSNFILKLDDRSLPSGYRVTTENPRVERLTRGKMAKFNFGATIHRVVRLDVADGVFEENSTQMRPQWVSRIGLLLEELRKAPAVLRLSYLADVEDEALATARVNALKQDIADRWAQLDCCYVLTTETEIFWRRGGPPVGVGRD